MADAAAAEAPKRSQKEKLLALVSSLNEDDDDRTKLSKKISWVLRHGYRKCNLTPDDEGWIKMSALMKVELFDDVTEEALLANVEESNKQKQRYEVKTEDDGKLIKASDRSQKKKERAEQKEAAAAAPRPGAAATAAAANAAPPGEKKPMNKNAAVFVPGRPFIPPPMPGYPGYGFNPYDPTGAYAAYGMAPPPPPPPQAPAGNLPYSGKIKSFNKEKGFGFIECAAAHQQYGRDVFVHKATVGENVIVGTDVKFAVELNKQGMPQARDVWPYQGKGVKASGGKGEGKSKGKGKGKGKKDKEDGEKAEEKAEDAAPEEKKEEEAKTEEAA